MENQKEEDPKIGKGGEIDDKTLSAGHITDIRSDGTKDGVKRDDRGTGEPQSNASGEKVEQKDVDKVPITGASDADQVKNNPVAGTGSEAGLVDNSRFRSKSESNTEPTKAV